MKIHKEGYGHIIITLVLGVAILALVQWQFKAAIFWILSLIVIVLGLVVNFFRSPDRKIPEVDDNRIYAPADGKVVVMEEVFEKEYFQSKRIQVSIFMSPLDVHLNRVPCSGRVRYKKHHPGKYLFAWHPKSSKLNERTTIVIQNTFGEVLIKQIAGAAARRIRNYLSIGDEVSQGQELGFIKFGSRVDILLPINSRVMVQIGDKVKGNQDLIAYLG